MKSTIQHLALLAALATSARANLVSHWSFDTADGAIVADSQGNFNGTLSGTTPYVAGISGQALSFDRTLGSFVTISADNALNWSGSAFSFSLWIKTSTTEQLTFFFSKHESGFHNGYGGALNQHNSGSFGAANAASFYVSGSDQTTSAVINDDTWHHLAFVYDAGISQSIYVDGVNLATTSTPSAITGNSVPLILGGMWLGAPTSTYTGLLDEVRLYNHALSAGEVATLAIAIPEPAGFAALAGLATLGLAATRRRRA